MNQIRNPINSRGMIEIVVILLVALIATFGMIYHQFSRYQMSTSYGEALKIKARNLARAGAEKAILLVKDRYSRGYSNWRYPDQVGVPISDNEFKGKLGEGNFEILSVKAFYLQNGMTMIGPYQGIPYYRIGERNGFYDILEIRSLGKVKSVSVECRLLVKIIRKEFSE